MRPVLIPALTAAALSTAAFATTLSSEATGTVKAWDANARLLTLDSGAAYTLPAGTRTAFKAGEKVHVIYAFTDGKNIANAATIVH